MKIEIKFTVQDTIPKQRPRNGQNEEKTKKRTKVERQDVGVIKAVPRARRQAKPKLVRPKIELLKPVRPKIKALLKLNVNI